MVRALTSLQHRLRRHLDDDGMRGDGTAPSLDARRPKLNSLAPNKPTSTSPGQTRRQHRAYCQERCQNSLPGGQRSIIKRPPRRQQHR